MAHDLLKNIFNPLTKNAQTAKPQTNLCNNHGRPLSVKLEADNNDYLIVPYFIFKVEAICFWISDLT